MSKFILSTSKIKLKNSKLLTCVAHKFNEKQKLYKKKKIVLDMYEFKIDQHILAIQTWKRLKTYFDFSQKKYSPSIILVSYSIRITL